VTGDRETLPESLELALSMLADRRGAAFAALIRPILFENLKRSRIKELPGYVNQVACRYDALNGYLHALQVVRSDQVWEPLLSRLQAWAFSFLGRWPLNPEARSRYSFDCADQAAVEMMAAHFPYDVEFDSWARESLQLVCLRRIEGLNKSKWFQLEISVDWEEHDEWDLGESGYSDSNLEFNLGQTQAVETAICSLPQRLGLVIRLHYYVGLSFAEISNLLQIPSGTVYKRHFDAKKRLARFLLE